MNDTINIIKNEYNLLLTVTSGEASLQRKFSEKINISLGMINLCLRHLIRQSYIKTHGLNKRKVKYLLTPKGFSEKMKKTYHYTQKTINELSRIKSNIQNEIKASYLFGERNFTIAEREEISDLTESAMKNLKYKDINHKRINGNGKDVLNAEGRKFPLLPIVAKL